MSPTPVFVQLKEKRNNFFVQMNRPLAHLSSARKFGLILAGLACPHVQRLRIMATVQLI